MRRFEPEVGFWVTIHKSRKGSLRLHLLVGLDWDMLELAKPAPSLWTTANLELPASS